MRSLSEANSTIGFPKAGRTLFRVGPTTPVVRHAISRSPVRQVCWIVRGRGVRGLDRQRLIPDLVFLPGAQGVAHSNPARASGGRRGQAGPIYQGDRGSARLDRAAAL